MGAVDDQQIRPRLMERGDALAHIRRDAHRRRHAQTTELVLGRFGIASHLLDVLQGDETLEVVILVHDEELLDAVAVQDSLAVVERRSHRHRDQFLPGHQLSDRLVQVRLEAHVSVRENADEASLLGDGHSRDVVGLHDFQSLAY